jgi:hypothetical protein
VREDIKTKSIFEKTTFLFFTVSILFMPIASFAEMLTVRSGRDTGTSGNCLSECGNVVSECLSSSIFLETMFFMFIALVIWTVSPIGILFFLAARPLFSKNSSVLIRKIAWVGQGVAFLMWLSAMTLLFIVYLDSVFYNILDLGGRVLNFALVSGLAFAFIMFVIVMLEKKLARKETVKNEEGNNKSKKENENEKEKGSRNEEEKRANDSIKIAGIEFKGIKEKVKGKLKEDLKEIIDDEIDRL